VAGIHLNGAPRTVPDGSTVLDLLSLLELPKERVAVEVDGEIVRKSAYAERVIEDGARVEVVGFVGGG
jgi:thiamine biosynthesis protein ThiS